MPDLLTPTPTPTPTPYFAAQLQPPSPAVQRFFTRNRQPQPQPQLPHQQPLSSQTIAFPPIKQQQHTPLPPQHTPLPPQHAPLPPQHTPQHTTQQQAMMLCCRACGAAFLKNDATTAPPTRRIGNQYFNQLATRLIPENDNNAHNNTHTSMHNNDSTHNNTPNNNNNNNTHLPHVPVHDVYVVGSFSMLRSENCAALPTSKLPPSLQRDKQNMQQHTPPSTPQQHTPPPHTTPLQRLSIWAPSDSVAYVPLFCKQCRPNAWVGVLVAAADRDNSCYLNQVWLSCYATMWA
eukprot:TRINITY_DN3429_c0_g1_i1.p1 TRINITY_DN3429_c0_g1~~TRINITY_DN3429_c0_g1_i1.p1  ORF type:complete len:290 (-),score=107.42 TRINITY_DN3429_c0_g1_i1:66-935(-)